MNTPAHMIFSAAAFARNEDRSTFYAASLGGLAPDISMLCLTAWALFIDQQSRELVFGTLYFSDRWQSLFVLDNSLPLSLLILAAALWSKRGWALAFTGGYFLHLVMDFLLHHDDARQHFWPFSDGVFQSPVSYWDPRHYGNVIAPIEALLVLVFAIMLWHRLRSWDRRVALVAIAGIQLVPILITGGFHGLH